MLSLSKKVTDKLNLEYRKGQCEGSADTLHGYFQNELHTGKIIADQNALLEEGKQSSMTFGELDKQSTLLSLVIREKVIRDSINTNPDEDILIGVSLPPSFELIVILLAILKSGASYVPISLDQPKQRVLHIINDCRPIILIHNFDKSIEFETYNCNTFPVRKLLEFRGLSNNVLEKNTENQINANGIALVLYTSGSTGIPKGVRITHRSILNRLQWQWKTFPYSKNEKCCINTTITFGDSVAEIFGPLLHGVPTVIMPRSTTSSPHDFLQAIIYHKITRIVLVPSLLRSIIQILEFSEVQLFMKNINFMDFPLKLWICSGEAMDAKLIQDFFRAFQNPETVLCNFYGSSELTFDATFETFRSMTDLDNKLEVNTNLVPIGKPIFNAKLMVLDDDLNDVPIGKVGELYVSGLVVSQGYVGKLDSSKFMKIREDIAFKTGDLVRANYSKNGTKNLYFIGRIDSQIKVRGQKVGLVEISIVLNRISQVQESVVLGYKIGTDEQQILGFVRTSKNLMYIEQELEKELESYKIPTLVKIPKIPLLSNGKTDRQELFELYEQRKLLDEPPSWGLLPSNLPIEVGKIVVETISHVLNVSQNFVLQHIKESYFSLGGSSLNSIVLLLQLRKSGISIDLHEFLGHSSVLDIIEKCYDSIHRPEIKKTLSNNKIDFDIVPLAEEHREELFDLISYGYVNRGDLEVLIKLTEKDLIDWLNSCFQFYISLGLSFVVKHNSTKKLVGSALNRGLANECPFFQPVKPYAYILEICDYLDSINNEKLPSTPDKIFRSGATNTCRDLKEQENLWVIKMIEEHNITVAKNNGFLGILSTNYNLLTQQVNRDILGYEVLLDYQVNQFISPTDGSKPFKNAADNQRAICCYKYLN